MKIAKIFIIVCILFITACSTNIITSDANQIEEIHKQNLEYIFAGNFNALESRFSKEFKIIGSKRNKTLNFIEQIKKEFNPDHRIFKQDVHDLYNFNDVHVFDYDKLVENGMAKEINFLEKGDFFAQINAKEGVADKYGIEELAFLYRKINGNWIVVGGTQ